MWVYIQNTEITNAYIWIPYPESIVLDKSSISLTTVWQTEQLTATITPDFCDKRIIWTSSDTSIATVGPITSRLPSAYQEVEYIESNWTQKISTGYITNSNIRIESEFMITGSSWDNVLFWTTYWSWAWVDCLAFRATGTWNFEAWASSSVNWATTVNEKYTLDYTLSSISLDWNTKTLSASVPWTNELTIFYWNWKWWSVRVYSFKVYTGSTLERDFVPCYRIADWVIWMYDLVNDVFYTNSWSWTFTKWADVDVEWMAVVTCVTPWECTITATTVNGLAASCSVGQWGWQPWADTIVYYPLDNVDTVNNLWTLWSSYNLMNNWVTFSNQWWYFNWSSYLNTNINLPNASQYTIAFWVKPEKAGHFAPIIQDWDTTASYDFWIECDLTYWIWIRCKSDNDFLYKKPSSWDGDTWYCVILTMSSAWREWFLNNSSIWTWSGASNVNTNYHHQLQVWRANDWNETWWPFKWYIWHLVIDTSIWDLNERSNYYNQTKRNYWL